MSVEEMVAKKKHRKVMGPVDYLMVGFPGNKFSGKIMPALMDLERRGIVRVIDLVFVLKDADGKLLINEATNLPGDVGRAYAELASNTEEWFFEGDIHAIAESLPNNSSAALLLYENVWAVQFKEALLDADAELIDMGRIAPEAIAEAERLMTQGGA